MLDCWVCAVGRERVVSAALVSVRSCRSRIVEIFGPESSGKTTLALHVIAQAQKAVRGGSCEA